MIVKFQVKNINNIGMKISKDGKYLASAQKSFPGFAADVIVWDFEAR